MNLRSSVRKVCPEVPRGQMTFNLKPEFRSFGLSNGFSDMFTRSIYADDGSYAEARAKNKKRTDTTN
jgi:hypothetical protein